MIFSLFYNIASQPPPTMATSRAGDKNPHQNSIWWGFLLDYTPMHEVVPRAVNTAEMIDARICSVHLSVSFFVISYLLPD